jgi:hypothetical protein
VLRQRQPLRELLGPQRRVLELDEQRGAELALAAEKLVVGLDLVADSASFTMRSLRTISSTS